MLLAPLISLPILFVVQLFFHSTSYANIPLGSTLTPSNPNTNWTSPNNTFSVTFIPIHSTKPTCFFAAISFDGIPVWKAGGDAGAVNSSARFELLLNGNLRLINGSGYVRWESGTANQGITTGILDDSGNLCLKNGSITIWSSFLNPTDTLLPNQNFTSLKSLQSGPYSFVLLNSGTLTLRWNRDTIYWNQTVNSSSIGSLSSPSVSLEQTGILQLFDPSISVPVVMVYTSDYEEGGNVFRFMRLDSDGNLRIYTSVRGSRTYTERWAAVSDQCRVYGWCGNMGICSYNDSKPVCGCPSQNFEFSDMNDHRKGCKRKVKIEDCPGSATMWQMDNTQILSYPPDISSHVYSVGSSSCSARCLSRVSCVASTSLSDGTGQCYLILGSNFFSGYHSPILPSTSFVKVCGPTPIPSTHIPLGSTLTPSNPNTNSNSNWTSPTNTFSVTFIPVYPTTSFSAAVSFSGIPVWKAGGESCIVDSSGRFELLLNGNLLLINGSGIILWESQTANQGVTTATLDDSGNLSLINGMITIWSSFDNPTDTILPNQKFTTTKSLQSGPYSFILLSSGELNLRWNQEQEVIYWNLTSSSLGNLLSPSLGLKQSGILQLFDPTLSVPVTMAYSSDYGEGSDILRFLRLDSDGNLRIYSSVRGSGTYIEMWAAVSEQCRVYGWCGNMGICSYIDSKPVCGCPSQNFEFSDVNDTRKGCTRKVEIEDCPTSVTMLQLDHTQFLTYPPELSSQVYYVGSSGCRGNCLSGSSCVASTTLAAGTGECYLKWSNFVSGYQSPTLPSISFVKVCSPAPPQSTETLNPVSETRKVPAWVVVLSSLVGLVLLEVGLWWFCCKKNPIYQKLSTGNGLVQHASGTPVQSPSIELQQGSLRCAPVRSSSTEIRPWSLGQGLHKLNQQ